jgi:hypothetical protein
VPTRHLSSLRRLAEFGHEQPVSVATHISGKRPLRLAACSFSCARREVDVLSSTALMAKVT